MYKFLSLSLELLSKYSLNNVKAIEIVCYASNTYLLYEPTLCCWIKGTDKIYYVTHFINYMKNYTDKHNVKLHLLSPYFHGAFS